MPDREELMYLVARALAKSRGAAEFQEAAAEFPASFAAEYRETATRYHEDTVGLLDHALDQLRALRDAHKVQS
jgi:predicted outer membrane protein